MQKIFSNFKNILANTSVFLVSLLICLLLGEFAFRWALFSDNKLFADLRNPSDYGEWNSDYTSWYLLTQWDLNHYMLKEATPLLGWASPRFNGKTFEHTEEKNIGKRRPILLYGDSFSACIDSTECFEEILNKDSSFTRDAWLVNYGAGGYGVDQIQLLMSTTVDRFQKPFVVFAFLTFDLDRSSLPFRDSTKPYYSIENDSLVLHTDHLKLAPADYLKNNPPQVTSYMWRKLVFNEKLNLKFDFIKNFRHNRDLGFAAKKIALNKLILDKAVAKLKATDCDYVFMIFSSYADYITPQKDNWRENFIKDYTEKNKIPVIWTKDIMKNHLKNSDDVGDFFIPTDGHPTTYFNGLISARLVEHIRENSAN